MREDSEYLRQIMEGRDAPASVLAVTSGKGGVGKSNISANLAICLAAAGKKVALVDADLGLGNLDVVLNINSKYNISHLINGSKTVEEIIQVGPEGVEVICGASGLDTIAELGQFQRQRLLSELEKLQDNYDVIIIDTGAGISKSVLSFCLSSDHVLVISTPEPTSITDAYAMIKVLTTQKFAGRLSLLINMASSKAEGKQVYRQIASVAKRFLSTYVYEAGVILKDERLCESVKVRKAVVLNYPHSQITRSIAALATKLSRGNSLNSGEAGFFKRVVNWLF